MSTAIKTLSIPLSEAVMITGNWRDSDHHLKANSFIFNADDFRALLAEPTIRYVRLYLGVMIDASANENNLVEKMICVGADDQQKDMVSDIETFDTSGVYDFSHPCPPLCTDLDSPLAGGIVV